jgi:imidazolonepropionase-like amidohydrolase
MRVAETRRLPPGGARSRAAVPWLLAGCLTVGVAAAHDRIPSSSQTRPVLLRGGDLYTVADGSGPHAAASGSGSQTAASGSGSQTAASGSGPQTAASGSGPQTAASGVLLATDLLFVDGRIAAIGRGLVPPADAEVVDVTGKRVYPGLIAANTALGLREIDAVRSTRDLAEVGELHPEVAAHVAWNPDSVILPTVRNHGIATAQVVPTGGLLSGRSMLVHLDGWTKEDAAVRLIDGVWLEWPEVGGGGPGEAPKDQERRLERQAAARRALRQAFADARAYAAAKGSSGAGADLRWEALQPVLAKEQPLYVAADDARQIVEALDFAREQDLRIVIAGGREADAVAPLLAAADVPVLLSDLLDMPVRDDDPYDQAFTRPSRLAAAGVSFCLTAGGTWQVRNLPLQAGQAVAFGLAPELALRAVTLSCAEILGIADREGSLTVGKDATLFVAPGDVLDVLSGQVERMWIQGRPVDLDDKQRALWRKYQAKP